MRNFLSSLLGALVALILFCGGAFLLFIMFVAGIAAMGGDKAPPSVEKGAYLVFDLSTNLSDASPAIDLGSVGGHDDSLQVRTATRALLAAAKDDRIAGVFIAGDLKPAQFGSGYAALEEVRAALEIFKSSGKPIRAYLTQSTTKGYYLASTATELAMDPYGLLLMPGLSSEPMYYAGAFEKYGVGVQVTRVGKYKSAIEPFTRQDMSPESREQMKKLLDDVWAGVVGDIAVSRKLATNDIQAVVDTEGLIRADAAKAARLVDRVAYRDEIFDELKEKTGRRGSKQPFKQILINDYARLTKENAASASGSSKIAVVYAEGEIVDGEGDLGEVGGSKFSRELRKLRQDSDVKAVVLRVNSPGGSATASETIQREVRLMKKVKPIVVSMGTYAASGGYWIAAYGDRIFAEPTTITGSIGVFGVQFDVKKLANNFGLTFDSVKTGKFADAVTISRPKTEDEMAVFQRLVDWIYGEFVAKVAEGRNLDKGEVERIAQGRVWSGAEAKKLGLVDEIGGLEAAIAHAAQKANLGNSYKVVEVPRSKELFEAIQEILDKVRPGNARARGLTHQIAARIEAELKTLRAFNDPQGLYARLPLNFSIR
jgi:protease-4